MLLLNFIIHIIDKYEHNWKSEIISFCLFFPKYADNYLTFRFSYVYWNGFGYVCEQPTNCWPCEKHSFSHSHHTRFIHFSNKHIWTVIIISIPNGMAPMFEEFPVLLPVVFFYSDARDTFLYWPLKCNSTNRLSFGNRNW